MKICKLKKSYLESYIEEFKEILRDIPYEYWEEEHFLKELNDKWNYSLVAQDSQSVIGYIIASNKIDSIHIHKFMVGMNWRSQGVGLELLQNFENLCLSKSKSLITLKVYITNEKGIKFYLRNGFRVDENCESDLLLMMYKKL